MDLTGDPNCGGRGGGKERVDRRVIERERQNGY